MRNWLLAFCGFASIACFDTALGQNLPTGVVAGQVAQAIPNASCYVNRGLATYQRNFNLAPVAGTVSVASMQEIYVNLGTNLGYDLSGQAVLSFSSSTSGNIHFKQLPTLPASYKNPTFSNYSETFSATSPQISITFTVAFPGCSMPIGIYLDSSS